MCYIMYMKALSFFGSQVNAKVKFYFFKRSSKLKVKVTESTILVQAERSYHNEYLCVI